MVDDNVVSVMFNMAVLENHRKALGLSMLDVSYEVTGRRSDMYFDLCLAGGRCSDWSLIKKIVFWYGDTEFLFEYIEPLVEDVLREMLLEQEE